MRNEIPIIKGRGAQHNPQNRFLKTRRVAMHIEALDEPMQPDAKTIFLVEHAKSLVNKVESPDVGMAYSMNPYQGCEHGCAYCYARNSHEYWGYSAGIDFEQKIIVKQNAPKLLRKFLEQPNWEVATLSLSGNTDCYQPAEQKFKITRKLLEICNEYNQPVSLITKNASILKDLDILQSLASKNLVSVMVTITCLDESIRRNMEPRTTTALQRLKIIQQLSTHKIPTGVMVGPVVPGLTDHEMHHILKAASENGATTAGYTFIRLNGSVQLVFHEWLYKNFPEKADKVWRFIQDGHGGKVNDSRFGLRMRGEGTMAELINQQFKKYCKLYKLGKELTPLNKGLFCHPGKQLQLPFN